MLLLWVNRATYGLEIVHAIDVSPEIFLAKSPSVGLLLLQFLTFGRFQVESREAITPAEVIVHLEDSGNVLGRDDRGLSEICFR